MKNSLIILFFLTIVVDANCQQDNLQVKSQSEINKEIARNFYRDLWFSNNTDKYVDYVAEQYVVHDIWDRKNVTEPAIEQKYTADQFWDHGELSGTLDYQIAEGNLVATRWHASFEPKTFLGMIFGMKKLAIINVFRIENGKIVEIWNHRHDIETNQTLTFIFKGLLIGLIIALIPTFIAFRLRKKLRGIRNR